MAAKAPVTFTVKTPKDAKFLAMFSESGSKVKVWGYSNYSKVSGGTRVWTVSYAISNKGNRQLTFRCTKTTTYGEGKTVDLKVVAEQPAVTRVSANKSTVAAKEAVTFTVKTPASA